MVDRFAVDTFLRLREVRQHEKYQDLVDDSVALIQHVKFIHNSYFFTGDMSSVPEWDFDIFSKLVFLNNFPEEISQIITELWYRKDKDLSYDLCKHYYVPSFVDVDSLSSVTLSEFRGIIMQRLAYTIALKRAMGRFYLKEKKIGKEMRSSNGQFIAWRHYDIPYASALELVANNSTLESTYPVNAKSMFWALSVNKPMVGTSLPQNMNHRSMPRLS